MINHTIEDILKIEPIFFNSEYVSDEGTIEDILAPSFIEISSSGKVYSRDHIKELLMKRLNNRNEYSSRWYKQESVNVRPLANDLFIVTYILTKISKDQKKIKSIRTSIWTTEKGYLQVVFHQGTLY